MKMELFKNSLQTGGILRCWFYVLVWMENILKMKLCDNVKVDNLVISLPKSSSNTNPK